jgi:hypothetical protein
MKACFLFISIAVACCALTLTLARGGPDDPGPADREVGELRKQVDELQARVKALEERLSRLESSAEKMDRWRQPPETPAPPPWGAPKWVLPKGPTPAEGGQPPKIWGQREINGWTFYLIPCKEQNCLPAQGGAPIVK